MLERKQAALPEFEFIDLFAGIGGFRSALTKLGGIHRFSSEWDKSAAKTYAAWYGSENLNTDDIRDFPIAEIPDHDLLAAGFPCQPFSIAGVSKKNSMNRPHGFDDLKQGNLFEHLAKIISEKRPRAFILENVKNLQSHDGGNTWREIKQRLEGLDYVIDKAILSSETFVPQRRQRIFIVGLDSRIFGKEALKDFEFPQLDGLPLTLEEILEQNPDRKYMISERLWAFLQDYRAKHKAKGNGFGFKLFNASETARTMSARYYKDGADILIEQPGWDFPRKLTPSEALKLMGFSTRYSSLFNFPDGFPQVASDTQTYKQCGNAVVPQVVEAVAEALLKRIDVLGGFTPKQ